MLIGEQSNVKPTFTITTFCMTEEQTIVHILIYEYVLCYSCVRNGLLPT